MTTKTTKIDFAEFLLRRQLITDEQAHEVRRTVEASTFSLGRLLVATGLLSQADVANVLRIQREQRHLRFGEIAVREGLVTAQQVAEALRVQLRSRRNQVWLVYDLKLLEEGAWAEAMIEYASFLEHAMPREAGAEEEARAV